MAVLGRGDFKPVRTTGEIFVRGTTAYTTTWGNQAGAASAFYIWDVSADVPKLVDSVRVDNSQTLGDIAVSDDGTLLVVATEYVPGSIVVYSLANPRKPVQVSRFASNNTIFGVHTAEIGRVNGKLYAFLCIDTGSGVGGQVVIVDLTNPSAPQQVYTQMVGLPYTHDTFVRDGLLYLGLWNAGVAIWDIGGGSLGGTPTSPKEIGRLLTVNGHVHNIWWLKDPVTHIDRYAFIGREQHERAEGSRVLHRGRRGHAQFFRRRTEWHPVRRVLQRRRPRARRPWRSRHLYHRAEVHPAPQHRPPLRSAQNGT